VGRYTYQQWIQDNGNGPPIYVPDVTLAIFNLQNHNWVLSDTHTFSPALINELRVAMARNTHTSLPQAYDKGWAQKLGLPANVPGTVLPRVGNGMPGISAGNYTRRGSTGWQFFEMVTKIKGSHALKFGYDHRINRAGQYETDSLSGNFNFSAGLTGNPQSPGGTGSTYATFLLGAVSSAEAHTHVGQYLHGFTASAFVQDDWKAARRLTLNIGLRYDYQQQPVERWNGQTSFDPFSVDPVSGLLGRTVFAGLDGQGRSFRSEQYKDFSPRFGFAYDPFGHGKTVIRGGYAIYYPSIWNRMTYSDTQGFGRTVTTYAPPGNNPNLVAFPFRNGFPFTPIQPQGSALGPSAFLGQSVSWDEPFGTTPRSQQWTLSVQQQLRSNWLIDVAYSANRGTHFPAGSFGGGYDFNQLDPQYLSLGQALNNQVPNPYAGRVPGPLGSDTISRSQSLRPYPYYQRIDVRSPRLGSYIANYLLLSVEKRMSSGFTALLSYTAGKVISDNVSSPIFFIGEQTNIVGWQNGKFNRRGERSLDPTDVSQRAVLSLLYELPFGRGKRLISSSRALNQVIGGWQLNVIGVLQTGVPMIVRGANNFLADRPNSTGTSAKLSDRTAARWFDTTQFVNPPAFTFGNISKVLPDVRVPGTHNWDFSVIKNTSLGERLSLQFRFESFNVLNHVNLGFPNGVFSPGPDGRNISGAFGVITSSRDARNIQLGIKLIF
jgi:hypothetical protein